MQQAPLIQEPLTLSQLEAHLWEAANILRGSPVDRTDWKSYILQKHLCGLFGDDQWINITPLANALLEDNDFVNLFPLIETHGTHST